MTLALAAALVQPARAKVFDGGVDSANLGKGEWIYVLANATSGLNGYVPSVTDVPSMMSYFQSIGIQFLIVKAGTGSTNFPSYGNQFTPSLVAAAHAKGIKIFGDTRSYGSDILGESRLADYCFQCGADGFVLDAEQEWESVPNNTLQAWQLCGMIKTNWPTKFLAHSPQAIISGHSSFPYKEFGYWCDAVMPMDYWADFADNGHGSPVSTIQWMDSNWGNFQNTLAFLGKTMLGDSWTNAIKPLAPMGQADAPGLTNQTYADMTNFVYYLKNDPTCVTKGGYKGCCFYATGEVSGYGQDQQMLAGIAACKIGDYAPSITSQPQSQAVVAGANATFTVVVDAVPAATYQWLFNGSNLAGATRSSFLRSNAQPADQGNYSVVLSNYLGMITSSVAVLTVSLAPMPPSIIVQPQPQAFASGQTATFSVEATGTTPLSYQWRGNGSLLPGATKSSYSTTIAANYSVVITNLYGSVTSAVAALNLVGDIIIDNTDPGCSFSGSWITGTSANDKYGANYSYCTAGNSQTATYTPVIVFPGCYDVYIWYPQGSNRTTSAPWTTFYNGGSLQSTVNQTGGGGQWVQIASAKPFATSGGYVQLAAANASAGNVMADAVRFSYSTVQPPLIAGQPQSQTVAIGAPVNFVVIASGGALSYQWQFNGTNIAGASGNSYSLPSAQLNNAGSYTVTVSNSLGVTNSAAALLTVGSTAINFDSVSIVPGYSISFVLTGDPGNYVIEKSRYMSSWATVSMISISNAPVQYTDFLSTIPARFYRARSWP